MTTYIGLLRAVNLGGHNRIAMGELRELLAGLGLQDPRTLLQSGNVVFGSDAASTDGLERLLEEGAESRLGLSTAFLVRTVESWRSVIAENPFPDLALSDPGHLLVMFLKEPPDPAVVGAIQNGIRGQEQVRAGARHLYVTYPDGIGRSRLTSAALERKLAVGTARNWNTVLKLEALAAG